MANFKVYDFCPRLTVVLLLIFMLIPHKSKVQVTLNNQILKEATDEIKNLLDKLRKTPIYFDQATSSYWKQCVYKISHFITQIHQARIVDQLNNSIVHDFVLHSTEVFDHLIERTNKWYFLNPTEKKHFSAIIIESIRKLGFMLNSHEMSGEVIEFWNVHLKTFEINVIINEKFYFNFHESVFYGYYGFAGKIQFNEGSITNGTKIVITAFLLRNTVPTLSFSSRVNSDILSVVVESFKNVPHPNSIRIEYWYMEFSKLKERNDYKLMCASSDLHKWSAKHCVNLNPSIQQSGFKYYCECNYLDTAYSVLDAPNIQNPISHIEHIKQQLLNETKISQSNWTAALSKVNDLVSKTVESLKVDYRVNMSEAVGVTNVSIEILSTLIDQSHVYKNLSHQDKMRSTSLILNTVEDLAVLMASNMRTDNGDDATNINVTLEHGNVHLQSKLVNVEKNKNFGFTFDNIDLYIPFEGLNHLNSSLEVASTVVVIRKLSSYLDNDNLQVNSPIFSIMIENQSQTIQLSGKHKLKFSTKNSNRLQFGDESMCTFWNYLNQTWSKQGCSYNQAQSNRSYSTCECYHLANFAVLVDITNQEMHSVTKTILTFVCSCTTIGCLVGALYLLLKCNIKTKKSDPNNSRKMNSNRSHLIMWIAIWLIVTHIFVLIFLDRRFNESDLLCGLTSIVVLFSLLTTFAFMLMLSIHLYLSTSMSNVFKIINSGKYVLYAYLFSFFIVIFSLFFIYYDEFTVKCDGIAFWNVEKWYNTIRSMKGEYFCWISSNEHPSHIYIFIIPMSLVVFVNCGLLIQVLRVCAYKNSRKNPKQSQWLKLVATACLLFNVGTPWLTYIFYINKWFRGSFYSYLFIIMNGTQGIWIFAEQYYLYYWANRKIEEQSKQTVSTQRQQAGLTKQTNTAISNHSFNSQKSH